jgi:hypothetical protein
MAQAQELCSCCATHGYREHTYGIVHDAEEVVKADSGIQAGTEPADIGLAPILYRHRLRSNLSASSVTVSPRAFPRGWGFLQEVSCPKRSGIRLAHAAIAYRYLSGLSLGIWMSDCWPFRHWIRCSCFLVRGSGRTITSARPMLGHFRSNNASPVDPRFAYKSVG